jgi:hypothetical protein
MDARGTRRGTAALERGFGVSPGYISRVLRPKARNAPAAGLIDKPRPGRPTVMTAEAERAATKFAEAREWEVTYRDLADEMHESGFLFCPKTYMNWMRTTGWDTHHFKDNKPMLTAENQKSRLEFAKRHVKNKWLNWVDVDEKFFYTKKLAGKKKKPKNVEIKPQRVQHKSHVPKVMLVSALGRPRRGRKGFTHTGKIGTWRVAGSKVAQRKSKNHARGDSYMDDINMTADLYSEMMEELVFPAVREAYAGEDVVYVQQDGASPHTGKDMLARLNVLGASYSTGPRIVVVQQPPNSPDMNICDLSFFRALATDVHKSRLGCNKSIFDKDQLAADVEAAFEAYPVDALEGMWDYKEHVMAKVIAADGDNVYDKRRKSTPGRAASVRPAKRRRHDARS